MDIGSAKALVTGGGSGMGREFVLNFAKAGASVSFCDVADDGIAATLAAASEYPGKVHGFKCDVSNEEEVTKLISDAWAAMDGVNVVVNNAGIFRDGMLVKEDKETGTIKKMSLKAWNQVIAVDLTGPFLVTREFAAKSLETKTKGGVVVNISSISRHGNPGQSNYSAAKAGLIADTKLWGSELARYGIRVGAIAPGFIDTPILQGMRPEVLESTLKAVPMRRAGKPFEIYQAVKFIVECEYFTGKCVDVDGGLTL